MALTGGHVAGVSMGHVADHNLIDAALAALSGGQGAATPLRRLHNKVTTMSSVPARVRWLFFGDSYAYKIYLQIAPVLVSIFGGWAGTYFIGPYNGVTNNAQAGTVTDNTADVALWPSGLTTTLGSAGASRTYGSNSGGAAVCDTIRVIHANTGGTFKIQVDGVDNTTPAVTSDNSVTVTTITVARGPHTVTVVQLTGSPKIIGAGFEDSTASGLVQINVSNGGLNLSTITAQAWTNFATFLATVTPDVLTIEAKEDSATFPASLTSLFAATATQPGIDVIGIGTPATAVNDVVNTATNAQLKAACAANGYTFYDTYPILGNYATLVALGWQGDGVHVDAKADQYRGMLMLRDLGIESMYGRSLNQRVTVVACKVTVTGGVALMPSGAMTPIPWNSEIYDTNGFHDSAVNPSRLTIPPGQGGLYAIGGTWVADTTVGTSATRVIAQIQVNGAAVTNTEMPGGVQSSPTACTEAMLNPGDYVELRVYHVAGAGILSYPGNTSMYVRKVSI